MKSFYEKNKTDSLAFFIAGSNKELLQDIQRLMSSHGIVGVHDPSGKVHFIVEGRKGAQFAANRVNSMTQMLLRDASNEAGGDEAKVQLYVDAVLQCYAFRKNLRGYDFLRYILILLLLHPEMKSPMVKYIYSSTASAFRVSASQVERNLRYCFQQLYERETEMRRAHAERALCLSEGGAAEKRGRTRYLTQTDRKICNSEGIQQLVMEIRKLINNGNFSIPDLPESVYVQKSMKLPGRSFQA